MTKLAINSRSLAGALAAGSALAINAAAAQATPNSAPAAGRLPQADSSINRTLASGRQSGWSSVIITVKGEMTAQNQAALTALWADVTRRLPMIHAVAASVPTRNLRQISALPFVSHLSSDGPVKKSDEFTVGGSGAGVAYTQYGLTGQGIGVAVVDSGIAGTGLTKTCRDLIRDAAGNNSRLLAAPNFCTDDTVVYDDCGHGTHVAGIIAGNGYSSTGSAYFRTFYGIARNVNLISVKVLNASGQGSVSQVISGLQWVVANKARYNVRVINLSLGHPVGKSYTTDPLCQAVEAAWKAGIVVVCAAGNEGRLNTANTAGLDNEGWGTAYGSIASPGNDPYVITVGATKSVDGTRADDRIATYSSRGPSRLDLVLKPDLVAPGNRVVSVYSTRTNLSQFGSNVLPTSAYVKAVSSTTTSNVYFTLSGTSMAAPVVAGAAALLLQAQPSLTPDTVKARLMLTADKWADPQGNCDPCTYGAGYVNIPAALACTAVAGQPALSPDLSADSSGNVFINMDHALWGKSFLWGTGLDDLHAVWGKSAILGPNTLSASHALWGKSVWADRALWATTTSAVDLSGTAINGE